MRRWPLQQAARIIRAGGIVAYPTEAVYGLGCDPLDADAVLHLLELKQRPAHQGLILIASDSAQLQPYLLPISPKLAKQVNSTWPGPVTWLLPARPETPWWIKGDHDTIAVRVTAHPLARALCESAGMALVSTSANVSNHRPARTALEVRRVFGERVDCVLHGATGRRGKPTEIRDAATGRVVRAG